MTRAELPEFRLKWSNGHFYDPFRKHCAEGLGAGVFVQHFPIFFLASLDIFIYAQNRALQFHTIFCNWISFKHFRPPCDDKILDLHNMVLEIFTFAFFRLLLHFPTMLMGECIFSVWGAEHFMASDECMTWLPRQESTSTFCSIRIPVVDSWVGTKGVQNDSSSHGAWP